MKRYIEKFLQIIKNKNLVPKLGSILLAVILWAYISSAKSGDVRFKLPVTFTGLEQNFVVSKISHKFVLVEIRGNKDELKNVSSKNIKLFADLSKAVPGDNKLFELQYQKIELSDDFKVVLYPDEIKLLIEKKIARNVRIIPRYSGNTEKGFMTGKIRINPEYVSISGPVSVINKIGAVYTDEISVDNKNTTFRQDVKIVKINEEGLEYSLNKVNAVIPVLNYSEMTTFIIPVVMKNKKKGYNYTFNSDRVKITVVPPENKNISEHSYSAYIDADEIDIDNDEFLKKNKIDVAGYIHVNGDSSEADNGILSVTPHVDEIVVTKE